MARLQRAAGRGRCVGFAVALMVLVGSVEVREVLGGEQASTGDDLRVFRQFTFEAGTKNGVLQAEHTLLLEYEKRVSILLVGAGAGGGVSGGGGGGALLWAKEVMLAPGLYTIRVGTGGAAGGENVGGSDGAHTELLLDGNVLFRGAGGSGSSASEDPDWGIGVASNITGVWHTYGMGGGGNGSALAPRPCRSRWCREHRGGRGWLRPRSHVWEGGVWRCRHSPELCDVLQFRRDVSGTRAAHSPRQPPLVPTGQGPVRLQGSPVRQSAPTLQALQSTLRWGAGDDGGIDLTPWFPCSHRRRRWPELGTTRWTCASP